jgi:hypothetical protein
MLPGIRLLGAALEVAARIGGQAGAELAGAAKGAFINGMDLGLLTGAFRPGLSSAGLSPASPRPRRPSGAYGFSSGPAPRPR